MKINVLTIILLMTIVLIFPVSSFACACCAEPGAYSISTLKPNEYNVELLGKMKFDKAAFLFMTEAGFDGIKGLDSIAKSYESKSWTASPISRS